MSMCFALGCYHRALHDMCHFFRFPKDKQQFKVWREFCKKPDKEPKYDSSRLCSCHFVDGLKANGPSIPPEARTETPGYKIPERRRKRKTNNVKTLPSKKTAVSLKTRASATKESVVPSVLNPEPSSPKGSQSDIPLNNQGNQSDTSSNNQVTISNSELEKLKEGLAEAHMKIDLLETELALKTFQQYERSETVFSYLALEPNFRLFHYYTGLPNIGVFKSLLEGISKDKLNYHECWTPLNISLSDQLLITLMKLRLNFDFTDLSVRFNVSQGTVRNVFLTLIYEMHSILYPTIKMPSIKRTRAETTNLKNYKCIVDYIEIDCSPSRSTIQQAKVYSHFKQKNTVKGLVACSPQGDVIFISNLFPGSTSDKEVFEESGIMNNFVEGDLILSDKGLLISDILPPGVNCYIPNVLQTIMLAGAEETDSEIPGARIYIKRIIGRIKTYRILNCIPDHLRSHASIIFQLVGCLVSLHHPLFHLDPSLLECEDDFDLDM